MKLQKINRCWLLPTLVIMLVCSSAASQDRVPGDDCSQPIVITIPGDLPYSDFSQTTCSRGDDYSDTCLGNFDDGDDIIYRLDVISDTYLDINLDPKGTTAWTALAIGSDCPPGDPCLENATSNPYSLTCLHLVAGTYYVMVDTFPLPFCIPDFDLFISECLWTPTPVPASPGDSCLDAIQINVPADLPYSDLNQYTCSRGNDYTSTCLGAFDGGDDTVYQLNLAAETWLEITLDPKSTGKTGLGLFSECPPGDPCIASSTSLTADPHTIICEILSAGTYYLVVDTDAPPNCIPDYDLMVDICLGTPTPTPTATPTPTPTITSTPITTPCRYPVLAIPDNNSEGIVDSFYFESGIEIYDLDLAVDISHTYIGDLTLTLRHVETGTIVTFIDRPGKPDSLYGCKNDDILSILDDEAALPVEDQCATPPPAIDGNYFPNNPLSAFDGELLQGTWEIVVSDSSSGDTGVLNEWCLLFPPTWTPLPSPTPLSTPCSQPVLAIPDNLPSGIADSIFVMSAETITDLYVSLDVTHNYVGDLIFSLEHIDTGTTVTLIDRPGFPVLPFGCSQPDILAVLDDSSLDPVEDACDPQSPAINGVFSPDEPLSAFAGESLSGMWRMNVSDHVQGDAGILNGWCLILEPSPTPEPTITPTMTPIPSTPTPAPIPATGIPGISILVLILSSFLILPTLMRRSWIDSP